MISDEKRKLADLGKSDSSLKLNIGRASSARLAPSWHHRPRATTIDHQAMTDGKPKEMAIDLPCAGYLTERQARRCERVCARIRRREGDCERS
jgi:hypothetical protein